MKLGIFDHMDRGAVPLAEQYENRLRLAGAYDEAGFHMYHVAEHHSTPLGMSPSPSVYLSAIAQRTKRLRFGPLVYPVALYHPLRLAEEISMLDHMSGGRFEFGIGKGASHHELAIYGAEAGDKAGDQFAEARDVLLMALTRDTVDFEGRFYRFRNVPIELRPLQAPHPAMWYGVSLPDGAARAAGNGYNFVCNAPVANAAKIMVAYRDAWAAKHGSLDGLPLMGLGRFVVVADTEAAALETAGRAYKRWYTSFWKLWDDRGGRPGYVTLPDTFDGLLAAGIGIAGTPRMVADALAKQAAAAGTNYLVCRFAYGDITLEESMRSVELFAEHALPALKDLAPAF